MNYDDDQSRHGSATATHTAAPSSSANASPQSVHSVMTVTTTENEEKLTEALRDAADARLLLVSRLEENAKQSGRQTEMVAQLISLTQQLSAMREKEAEYLEEIDKLKDEVAMLRNQQSNNSNSSEYHNNDSTEESSSTTITIELNRLRSENAALKTQCEFLAEEMKSTINLAASSQRRSAELSRIISHDATTASITNYQNSRNSNSYSSSQQQQQQQLQ